MENDDTTTCRICGKKFTFLGGHIRRAHGITADEYRAEFDLPAGLPLASPEYRNKRRAIIERLQADGVLTYNHLPRATDAARSAGRGRVTDETRAQRSQNAKQITHTTLPPGAKRADGRDADHAREYQRAYRAKKRNKKCPN